MATTSQEANARIAVIRRWVTVALAVLSDWHSETLKKIMLGGGATAGVMRSAPEICQKVPFVGSSKAAHVLMAFLGRDNYTL